MVKELEKERSGVEQCRAATAKLAYDPAAAAALEEQAEAAGREVQRWRDRVDELGSQLAGESEGPASTLAGPDVRLPRCTDLPLICSSPSAPLRPSPCLPLPPRAAVDFRYADPDRGFDRSKVKGVVAKLTRVADPTASTALEVAAGGKLYQVGGRVE